MPAKVSRTSTHFVIVDGSPRRFNLDGVTLGPLRGGFSQFIVLIPNGESVEAKKLRATSSKEVAEKLGPGGSFGIPVGSSSLGPVFRVANVS